MPRVVRGQRFRIAEHGLDWPTRCASQVVAQQLVVHLSLAAEVSADVVGIDVDALLVHTRDRGQLVAQRKRHLVGAHHADNLVGVDPQQAAWRLDEALVLARCRERVFKDSGRRGEHLLNIRIILMNDLPTLDVGMLPGRALTCPEERVLVAIGVQDRRVVGERFEWIEDRRQLVVLDVDGAYSRLSCIG